MDGLSPLLALSSYPACFAALLCSLQNPASVCSPPIFKATPLQFEVWLEITSKNNGGKSIWPFTKLRVEFTKFKAVCAHACLRVCVCVQCFAVRSLGWVEMAEEDLAPGKSSVAVNNCIRQLSYCKNDIRDTVGIWGEVRNRLPG